MRVYFDICAIQRPLDDQTQLRVRAEAETVLGLLALCGGGTLELVASGVHVVENRKCPHPDRRAHVDNVLSLAGPYVSTGRAALARAEQYQTLGIKRLDALHLAAAVEAGVEYFLHHRRPFASERGRSGHKRHVRRITPRASHSTLLACQPHDHTTSPTP